MYYSGLSTIKLHKIALQVIWYSYYREQIDVTIVRFLRKRLEKWLTYNISIGQIPMLYFLLLKVEVSAPNSLVRHQRIVIVSIRVYSLQSIRKAAHPQSLFQISCIFQRLWHAHYRQKHLSQARILKSFIKNSIKWCCIFVEVIYSSKKVNYK